MRRKIVRQGLILSRESLAEPSLIVKILEDLIAGRNPSKYKRIFEYPHKDKNKMFFFVETCELMVGKMIQK
jgi:hypothetical protein